LIEICVFDWEFRVGVDGAPGLTAAIIEIVALETLSPMML